MTLSSIHALTPLEQGGSVARTGFLYQDHVAARFCLEMLTGAKIQEVWCETEDDITLLWDTADGALVEFVQVKGNELTQLWSTALICSGGATESIAAKSLQHDRCSEPCVFRIVTRTQLNPELAVLKLDRAHQDRALSNPKMAPIHQAVCKALDEKVSECGRSGSHWVADMLWDVTESETALKNANLQALAAYLEAEGETVFVDQCAELYDRLLRRVQDASFPKWIGAGQDKKIKHMDLVAWIKSKVAVVRGQAPTKGGENLHRKMTAAQIPQSTIENADHLRLGYRRKTLTPAYQRDEGLKSAELEVTAVLQELVSNLDAGALQDDGVDFHARCLKSLHAVQVPIPARI
jgi:hypothetical protein